MDIININIKEKVYKSKKKNVSILNNFSMQVEKGEKIALIGSSGAGKSSLLNILGLIDKKYDGTYLLYGEDASAFSDEKSAEKRNKSIGFVLQESALIDSLNIEKNIKLPIMYLEKAKRGEFIDYFDYIIEKIGITSLLKKKPLECSGGERSRAIFARGIIMKPEIILADEPEASLDEENKWKIIDLLFEINKSLGSTLITATHDKDVANKFDRCIKIEKNSIL